VGCTITSVHSHSPPASASSRTCSASRLRTRLFEHYAQGDRDRLAEAFAERLHERVRREFWGYAADEKLGNEQLIREEYAASGRRPLSGCPDHTEKATLWRLLDVDRNAGIALTESYAMYRLRAVSAWYFSHPQSRYLAVGRIDANG